MAGQLVADETSALGARTQPPDSMLEKYLRISSVALPRSTMTVLPASSQFYNILDEMRPPCAEVVRPIYGRRIAGPAPLVGTRKVEER